MLVEKEIISPGQYWYTDQQTGLPRKLEVTPELTKYWAEQGSKMLASGLTVPVPCEHDFNAHPMTPKDKLLNNAGWVKEYRLKDGNKLFGVVDIQDEEIAKRLPRTIRWTSPWINSFTDGNGKQWNNVISHLALTTRPRITKQAPFTSIAAALSMATVVKPEKPATQPVTGDKGFYLSKAARLVKRKRDGKLCPKYPMAFALFSGARFSDEEGDEESKKAIKPLDEEGNEEGDAEFKPEGEPEVTPDGDPTNDDTIDLPPYNNPAGDVKMEELLCDLLQALGVPMPDETSETEFKRHLYEATMSKIKELTSKGMADKSTGFEPDQNQPPDQQPNASQPNPLIQQEQQPMYMSLSEINKLDEPLKSVALAMYNETAKANAKAAEAQKVLNSLRDGKLKEEEAKRQKRVSLLSKLSPRVKADLEAMLSMPSMALSMGEGGSVIDPMSGVLSVLEKGLSDMPKLITADLSHATEHAQPTDTELSAEETEALADNLSRMMGYPAQKQAS